MRVLLDTRTLLWWALDDATLSRKARTVLASLGSEILVSASSAWEITTKVRLGKLPGANAFALDLSICVEHGQRAGLLPGAHKDPFDRMLIAQCMAENVPIVSRDEVFDLYAVQRIW